MIFSSLMLEYPLPMLKGRNRLEYAKEKKISPWSIQMTEDASEQAAHRKTEAAEHDDREKLMYDFPADIQENMWLAENVNRPAMKKLYIYKKRNHVRSEEFIYLLAQAHTLGCEFAKVSELSEELAKSSEQGKKAAAVLRRRIQDGVDVVDDDEGEDVFFQDAIWPYELERDIQISIPPPFSWRHK